MRFRKGKLRKARLAGSHRGRGAAVVEFALVAPLMFAIVFGIIEFGWRLMVRQTMVQACQVAARTASLPGSTDGEIMAAVQGHLEAAGYSFSESDYSVDIVHATPASPTETVTVAMPMERVSLTRFFGTPTGQMSVTTVIPKEGQF